MRSSFVAAALGASLFACAGNTKSAKSGGDYDQEETPRSKTEGAVTVSYGETPQDNWAKAEEEFKDENYLAAQKFYSYIRNKFPYSAFSTKAELRIADCLFERARFLEAIDAYSNFARLHPTHESVGYATFKVGASYYKQIPTDWFLIPPAYEKDQAAVKDAARALKTYVDRFPKDPSVEDGKKLLKEVRLRLVAHERAVADFYKRIDKPKAYAGRLEVIRRDFGDVAVDDELLFEVALAYAVLRDGPRTKQALDELKQKFPASPRNVEGPLVLASTSTATPARQP
jgi:outer membrane protein assembly factor BamD